MDFLVDESHIYPFNNDCNYCVKCIDRCDFYCISYCVIFCTATSSGGGISRSVK